MAASTAFPIYTTSVDSTATLSRRLLCPTIGLQAITMEHLLSMLTKNKEQLGCQLFRFESEENLGVWDGLYQFAHGVFYV